MLMQTPEECVSSAGNILCSTSYWTKGLSEPSASYLYILSQSLDNEILIVIIKAADFATVSKTNNKITETISC